MTEIHDLLEEQLMQAGNPVDERSAEYADESLALRFTDLYGQDLRYVNLWGRWMKWNGCFWEIDKTLEVISFARAVARSASSEIMSNPSPSVKLAASVASAKTISAIERLARADRRHASWTSCWDADPWILNTPGGTVDLATGFLLSHERNDYCTKSTAVAPHGKCPLWLEFLNRAFAGDQSLVRFAQRMLGYSLTGSIRDHALFFLYGTGGNGKGVFLNTWHGIMGDYAAVAPMETFTASQSDRHPTDLAMLRGSRAVVAQETEDGQRWAESKIKALTGGDPISARFMRQDFFTYQPQFKLIIAGNHKPSLRNVDEAVRRRLNLIPFTVTIPSHERDPNLPEKLKAEWPGILAWAIEGCLAWQNNGLQPPQAVLDATENYLADEDAIGRFLSEQCYIAAGEYIEVKDLYAAWRDWCNSTGEFAGTIKRFSQNLQARNYQRMQHPKNRRACILGLRLGAQSEIAADQKWIEVDSGQQICEGIETVPAYLISARACG